MSFTHFRFVYCSMVKRGRTQMKNYKTKGKKRHFQKALLQCYLPNVSISYPKYIYNILNAFWLFTAGPLTTEALESTSVIAFTWYGFNMHQRKAGFEKVKNQSGKYLYSFAILKKHDCLRIPGNCNANL